MAWLIWVKRWFARVRNRLAYARLDREVESLDLHLKESFDTDAQGSPWFKESSSQLLLARKFLLEVNLEGGWYCLHAARRLLIHGMDPEELDCGAIEIRKESEKLSGWRKEAITALLVGAKGVTPLHLIQATKVRDGYNENQYHRIWITQNQLASLAILAAIAISTELLALILLQPSNSKTDDWSPRTLVAVAVIGVCGSIFSVGQTMISVANSSKIPEYVANRWTTFMRTIFGSITGLAGYILYSSHIFHLSVGDDKNPLAIALGIAFIFGYSGEKLINKIVQSVDSSKTPGTK
jgi:hypothetical protein